MGEAEEQMLRARGLDPELFTLRYALRSAADARLIEAERLREAGRHDEAESAYRRVILLAPRAHWQAHHNLGKLLAARGRLPQALVAFRAAHELRPTETPVVNNLADALAKLGRYPEAIPLLEGLLKREPDNIVALTNLGTLYLRTARKDQARDVWRRLLKIDPSNHRVRKLLESLDS